MNERIICCLELSSTGVKMLAGYVYEKEVFILNAIESTRTKLVKGGILDKDEMVITIKELASKISSSIKFQVNDVVLIMPSNGVQIISTKGETNTNDSRISLFDASNCHTQCYKNVSDRLRPNYDIIDIVPYKYVYEDVYSNSFESERLPLNKAANHITMFADVEAMDGATIKNLESVVKKAGLNIVHKVCGANATINLTFSYNQSNPEFIFIDFGARQTTLGLSYEGRLEAVETLNYGSDDISDCIANKFNISFDKANEYKKLYGISKNPPFSFKTKDGFTVEELANVIKDSLRSLTDGINSFLLQVDANARNLFILTGGGSDLVGLDDYLINSFNNRVMVFTPPFFGARDKTYSNLVSAVKYYSEYENKSTTLRPNDLTLTRIGGSIVNENENNKIVQENTDERL